MKILINTLAELQKYLKVNSTFKVDSIKPYMDSAFEKYLCDVLGDDLADSLEIWYNSDNRTSDVDFDKLLPYAQRVIAKFAFHEAAPNLDLQLTEAGFGVVSNQTLAPASKDRVNRFVQSLESEGWDAVELLLRFLEQNADEYPLWTESDAFTMQMRNFINSAEEFDKYVHIGKSRLKFRSMRNTMDNVEILKIDPVLSEPLAEQIRLEIRENTLSDANAALLPFIRRSVANFTASEEIDARYKITAEHFLSEVRKKLDANPDDYPLYRDSIYVVGRTYERFVNEEDNAFFIAGQ